MEGCGDGKGGRRGCDAVSARDLWTSFLVTYTNKKRTVALMMMVSFLGFFFFFWPNLQHVEIPRLGIELEL